MSYKLIKEHGDKYEMQHPNGDQFIVAKKGLNKKVTEHIKSLGAKGYADGGVVEDNASVVPAPEKKDDQQFFDSLQGTQVQNDYQKQLDFSRASNPNMPESYHEKFAQDSMIPRLEREQLAAKNESFLSGQDAAKKLQEDLAFNERAKKFGLPERKIEQPIAGSTTQETTTQDIQAQEVTPKESSQPGMLDQSYGNIMGGLTGASKIQEGLAKQQANTYADLQKQYADLDAEHKKSQAAVLEETKQFQDAANKDVDPHRYWDSLSTGNKLSASIGVLLAGIGAGMVRGENQALKVIDQAINQDIESQKVNASKNMNLYRMNLDKYKNADEANVRTKIQLASLADLKLKQAEANAKSKEAKFALQTAQGEFQAKYAPLLDQAAQMKTQRQIMQMAQVNPEALTPVMAQYLPEKDRERFIPGLGFALDKVGADKIKMEIKPDHDDAVQAIDKMISLRKKYGSEIMNREAVAEADTLKGILKGKLRTFLVGPGAVSESEQKILDNIIQDPTSLASADASVYKRLESLKTAINTSYMNKAKLQGLDTSKQAQDNSMQVQPREGIPYKKVSGGWVPLKTGR